MDFLLRSLIYSPASACLFFFFSLFPLTVNAQDAGVDLKAQIAEQATTITAMEKRLNALEQSEIFCLAGKKVTGSINKWSPVSTCPESYAAMGVERLDLEGNHDLPNLHVNDLWCDQKGCRAWCIGSTCTVIAKCCKWQPGLTPTK